MTFQYFFFATVPGYFLQALPFALAAGVWYALRLHKKEPALPGGQVCAIRRRASAVKAKKNRTNFRLKRHRPGRLRMPPAMPTPWPSG